MRGILFTDGGARGNPGPAGIGFVLEIEGGESIASKKFIGRATNNQAEYEALLAGLKRAAKEGIKELAVWMDSELVVRQMQGRYRVKDADLKVLYGKVKTELAAFAMTVFKHIPREKNKKADKLVNEAIDGEMRKKEKGG